MEEKIEDEESGEIEDLNTTPTFLRIIQAVAVMALFLVCVILAAVLVYLIAKVLGEIALAFVIAAIIPVFFA